MAAPAWPGFAALPAQGGSSFKQLLPYAGLTLYIQQTLLLAYANIS
jgi:hypothetical protein